MIFGGPNSSNSYLHLFNYVRWNALFRWTKGVPLPLYVLVLEDRLLRLSTEKNKIKGDINLKTQHKKRDDGQDGRGQA